MIKKKKCTQVASTSEEEAAVSINIMFLLAEKRKNPLPWKSYSSQQASQDDNFLSHLLLQAKSINISR